MSSSWNPKNDIEGGGTNVAFSGKRTSQEKKLCTAVIVLLVLVFALVIAVIVVAILGRKPKMEEICTEASCVKTANFLMDAMNTSADPCEDFFEFSCGKWMKDSPKKYGERTLQVVNENLEKTLKEIFKKEKAKDDLPKSVKKIIKAFEICLEYDGIKPEHKAWIKKVTKEAGGFPLIDTSFRSDLFRGAEFYAQIVKTYIVTSPISILVTANPLNTSENVIEISQPSPSSSQSEMTKSGLEELAFAFGNTNNASIKEDIEEIFWLKEKIANLSRPNSEIMEDENERQLVTVKELMSVFPQVQWLYFLNDIFKGFLKPGLTITNHDRVFLSGKTYLGNILELLVTEKISERLLKNYAGALFISEFPIDNSDENSLKRKLRFKKAPNSDTKWSECNELITESVSPALDYLYGKYRKEKNIDKEIIDYMVKAMEEMIDQSTWLDKATKEAVQDKLKHMITFSSFPPWTQDVKELEKFFKDLPEMTDNSFENKLNLQRFTYKKYTDLYGQRNDRTKWPRISEMAGTQVNAFYVPDYNIVIIPAGIQQLPFYDAERPKYMNFGGMGLIYGHEMTHGLDESGSLRDKFGNLKNWWTEKANQEFKERSRCFVDQYSSYTYGDLNVTVDGKQTLSENIADNGGIRQAYLGYQKWVKDHGKEKRLPGLEKYTPEQLFFISFAESWCCSFPQWYAALAHSEDEHAADQFRIIGSLSNLKEFSETFNCKSGSKMNPKDKCIIW